MFFFIFLPIILLIILVYILNMEHLTCGTIKILKKTLLFSLPFTIVLSFILYFHFRGQYYHSWFYHFLLYSTIFLIFIWIIWGLAYAIYLNYWEKVYPSLTILTILLVLSTFFITGHQVFFRPWLEREFEPQSLNIGHLDFTKPKLINNTYTSIVNLSFYNQLIVPLGYLEYDITFTNLNLYYQIIDYYPDKDIIDEPSGYNKIFIRWKSLPPNETSFLKFNLSWDKTIGDNIPIDFSSDKTFIKISDTHVKCLPNEVNNENN